MEIKPRKAKNYNKLKNKDLQLKKLSDNYNSKITNESNSELSNKEKIIKKSRKEEHSINLDLFEFNENKKKTFYKKNENDLKKNNNDYSRIMREKKDKIIQFKIYRTNIQK